MEYPLNKYYNIEQLLKPDERIIMKHSLFYFTDERIIFSRFFHKYYEAFNYGDIKHIQKEKSKIFYTQLYVGITVLAISVIFLLVFNSILQFIFYALLGIMFIINYKVYSMNSIKISISYSNKKVAFFAGNKYTTIMEFINKMTAEQ